MCGVAGLYFHGDLEKKADPRMLKRMCDSIAYRGPDAEGVWIDGSVGLGHRRLAIIDLSPSGAQPMHSASGRYTIVYNGELYNYRELKSELTAKGHTFRSGSDTEVLITAYAAWGTEAFHRLNGIFAFAIWDKEARSLVLVRDPVGVKPLFFAEYRGSVTFGSEAKCILATGLVPRDINEDAVVDFFCQNYVAQPSTAWKHIRQLEPGTFLKVSPGQVEKHTFTSFREAPVESDSDWLGAFRDKWQAAVKRQTISDVPVGAFLSGGLDSAAVAKALKETGQENVRLFSMRFEDSAYDESSAAASTARALGRTLEFIDVRDEIASLPEVISPHFDELSADASALGVYLICKHAAGQVKVALSGDGGDELLAGYSTYGASLGTKALKTHYGAPLLRALSKISSALPARDERYSYQQIVARLSFGAALRFPRNHASWRTIQYPNLREKLFGEAIQGQAAGERYLDRYSAFAEEAGSRDALAQLLHMDFSYYLPNDMLTKVDRMSMAHGLEVRVPFLDIDFVRFCRTIPSSWKLRGSKKKFILKEYLKDAIPAATLGLPKAGFNFPIEKFLRGSWGDLMMDTLKAHSAEASPYLRIAEVEAMLAQQRSRANDYRYELYGILMFSLWLRNRKEAWRA